MEQREGKKRKVPVSAAAVAMDTLGISDPQHGRGTSTRVRHQQYRGNTPAFQFKGVLALRPLHSVCL